MLSLTQYAWELQEMHCGIVINVSNRKSDIPDAPRDDILSMIRGSADIYGPAAYTNNKP